MRVLPGDAASVPWDLECEALNGADGVSVRGRIIQPRLGSQFVQRRGPGGEGSILSWGQVDRDGASHMFPRAKLLLSTVDKGVTQNDCEVR